ncbi:MAG: glycosyltransferase [Flavobacteriaceae bacterium]|nr:glycosyltransferase [Flavobacteriaceae bacterium]
MKRPRVLHVIDKLTGGGAEVQLSYLVNNSNSAHTIVYSKLGGEELFSNDCVLIHIPNVNKLEFIVKLFNIVRNFDGEIVQGWLPEYYSVIAAFSCFFNKKKYISCDRRAPVNKISKMYFRDRLKLISHIFSDLVVANFSLHSYGLMSRKLINKKKFVTIYNGYELKKDFKREGIAKSKFKDLKLFFVGRLVSQKRPLLVIDIFDAICDRFPNINFELKIFGDGVLKDVLLQKIDSSRFSSRIEFLGYTSNWIEVITQDAILIYPSLKEGMPNIIFETVLNGNVFIASRIPEIEEHFMGVPEVFVEINDNETFSFCEHLTKLISDKEIIYDRLLSNAKLHSIDYMVNQWDFRYSELAKEFNE